MQLNITKIETLGAGNIYCQILDVIFPGKVPLSKINWKAKLDYEFINNLKLLQSTFDKLGVKKNIEVYVDLDRSRKYPRQSTKTISS